MISVRLQGQIQQPDGKIVPMDSKTALLNRGPVIPVVIHPNEDFAAALQAAGKPVPSPVSGIALVDTGATTTCIDGETAVQMGLASNGTAKMSSASHNETECLTYPVKLFFPSWNAQLDSQKAMGVAIKRQGIIALIGRDLLQNCMLVYNGPDGSFTIAV